MRLFVAIDIPDAVREKLAALVAQLRSLCPQARWVRPQGVHVTLKFIGEFSESGRAELEAQLLSVPRGGEIELAFRGVGFFPNERRPRVFWAGIEAPSAPAPMVRFQDSDGVHRTPEIGESGLAALAAEIETRLEPLGIRREDRAFHPHLTLARFDSPAGVPKLRDALSALAPFDFGGARASEFHLYQSQPQRGGAVYTRLATFPLSNTGRTGL